MHGNIAISRRLTVERLPGPEALEDIASEWRLIERKIAPRTPFTSPDWIVPWWKHFARRRQMLFHDEFYCHVVRSGRGRLVAVAPLMRTFIPGVGPPLLRIVQFFGADPALTEIRGVICLPEDQASAVEALAEHFRAHCGEWDVFRWTGLRHPVTAYMARSRCALTAEEGRSDFVVDLPESFEALRQQVSSNMRKNLRKAYESLERDGVAFSLRVTEQANGVAAAMERFLALHAARAEAADMIFHPNKFVEPHVRAFLADYLHGSAERGELKIFELEIGGVVVASRLAFRLGPDLYLYFAGYDPGWKNYSVMTVLMAEMFKWAFAHGVERVNLSTGADQSKLRWKPREVLFRDAVQASPTLRARAAMGVFHAYEALHRARFKAIIRGRRLADPAVQPPQPLGDALEPGQGAPRHPAGAADLAGRSRVRAVPG